MCVLYFLYTGLFWLALRNHPFAIVGISTNALVSLILVCLHIKFVDKNNYYRPNNMIQDH